MSFAPSNNCLKSDERDVVYPGPQVQKVKLDILFSALVMTEFAAFADHSSSGQAPDNRDNQASKQHFNFVNSTTTILFILTSQTVATAFAFTVFTTDPVFLKLL